MDTCIITSSDSATAPRPSQERGIFDLVLRGEKELTRLLLDDHKLAGNLQRLLALSLIGLGLYGFVVGLSWQWLTHPKTVGIPAFWTPIAFTGGFVAALVICLPSFYFYTQLAGLDASFRLVTAQALRTMASTSVLLLGFLPFYAALALGCAVGVVPGPVPVIVAGWCAPFLFGIFGIRLLYRVFRDLMTVVPITHPRRSAFLLRMVLCWAGVYAVIAPVAVLWIGNRLSLIW